MEQIRKLTTYQLRRVYFRPRDKDGNLIRDRKPGEKATDFQPATFKEMYFAVWRDRDLAEEAIETRWQQYLVENPGLAKQQ